MEALSSSNSIHEQTSGLQKRDSIDHGIDVEMYQTDTRQARTHHHNTSSIKKPLAHRTVDCLEHSLYRIFLPVIGIVAGFGLIVTTTMAIMQESYRSGSNQ